MYVPQQSEQFHTSPSKAEFIYTRANLKVPLQIKSPVDTSAHETVKISPLCLAVNVGCEVMVRAILDNLRNIDID